MPSALKEDNSVDKAPISLIRHVQHLNQVQLGRRWSLSPRTLERWRFHGTGPRYLKVGGRVLYRMTDIEAFEALRRCTASPIHSAQKEPRHAHDD